METRTEELASLAELVTMLNECGEPPIAMALAEVVDADQHRRCARLLTHLFDSKRLLSQLVVSILIRELATHRTETVLRSNNLASLIISYCFRQFGSDYVIETVAPIIKRTMIDFDSFSCFEVKADRLLDRNCDIQKNCQNLKNLTREVLDSFLANRSKFPVKLRCLFRCIHDVLKDELSLSENDALRLASGTLVFLRFINPFLTSLSEFGVIDAPCDALQRPFTLVAKLLQSAANGQPLREEFMKPFADFIKELQDDIDQFVGYLINNDEGADCSENTDLNKFALETLHYYLYTNQEKVAECLKERKLIGRKSLHRLLLLLNQLEPEEFLFK